MGKVHLGLLKKKKKKQRKNPQKNKSLPPKILITYQVFLGLPGSFIQTKEVSLKVFWSYFIRLFKPVFLLIISIPLELVSNLSFSLKIVMTCKILKNALQILISELK